MRLPSTVRANLLLKTITTLRIPLIAFLAPRVTQYDDERVVLRIRLCRRTRNHVGSMYVGALCTGADCAGGMLAMDLAWQHRGRVKVLFKDMKAEFLRRADGHVDFTCEDGRKIRAAVEAAVRSGERHETPVNVLASVQGTPVARFEMLLSARVTA
ncbi:MAG: YiiD C-terminal domain-containing protein [Deltaproteobacteria bacterium]|nr:YiiD C-terminal domain-containing protein [Deltaproteobacteria bacterium]